MGEIKGYVCDGGCGATTTIEGTDRLARMGWWTTFTPHGVIYTCGPNCTHRAIDTKYPNSKRELPQ